MLMTNNEIQNLVENSIVYIRSCKYGFIRCKTVKGSDGYTWLQNDRSITDHKEWIYPDGLEIGIFTDDFVDLLPPTGSALKVISERIHALKPEKVLTAKDIDQMIDEKNRQNPSQNQKNKNAKPVDKFTKPKNNQKNNQKNGKQKKIKNRFGGDK